MTPRNLIGEHASRGVTAPWPLWLLLPALCLFWLPAVPAQDEGPVIEPPLPSEEPVDLPDLVPQNAPPTYQALPEGDADTISLAGDWLYRPEDLLPPRNALQGPYIAILDVPDYHPWTRPQVDPRGWRKMALPGSWEEQAYAFAGVVWFRRGLMLPLKYAGNDLILHLGEIRGADEVFFNGHKIGETDSRPNPYKTSQSRSYHVPGDLVEKGRNQLAIRLRISGGSGGLVEWPHKMRIEPAKALEPEEAAEPLKPQLLAGEWRFAIESYRSPRADLPPSAAADDAERTREWHTADFDDSHWQDFPLPGELNARRFDYDGTIFFRKEVEIPDNWAGAPLTLELGQIGDADVTFFNGVVLGSTQNGLKSAPHRQYQVPPELVEPGTNVIAVRVFNGQFEGGLLGPAEEMTLSYGYPGIVALGDGAEAPEHAVLEIGGGLDDILADAQEAAQATPAHRKNPGAAVDQPYFRPAERRWAPTFPESADSPEMTAADVPGPGGVVVPNFQFAGLPELPEPKTGVFPISEFGAIPDDGQDDSAAMRAAVAAAAEAGGGTVLIGKGQWRLERPVLIEHDHIHLRGEDRQDSRLLIITGFPDEPLRFVQPLDTDTPLTLGSYVEAHADPDGLENLVIFLDDIPICGERIAENKPGGFRVGSRLLEALPRLEHLRQGSARLRAVATWANGESTEIEQTVQYDFREAPDPATLRSGPAGGGLLFRGQSQSHDTRRWFLREDGKRGDHWITLTDAAEFAPGEILEISSRSGDDWLAQLESARPNVPRLGRFIVQEIERNRVRLNQPLRLNFPAAQQASLVTLCEPVRFCAVENLTIEQQGALPLDAIAFEEAYGCRVQGVTVNRAGRAPLRLSFAKFCEIRDCHFEGSWNGPDREAGRVGFYAGWDCLMENVTVRDLPQSPYFAWSASGNVVRDSTFTGTGAFFGSGWAHENLVENCRIDAGTGRHPGYGVFASRPENPQTGPGGGPRNVFYNNDIRSSQSGIFLGGMNEGWIFLRNRLIVRSGSALETRMHSLSHTFAGNTVSLAQPWQPAFRLHDADCLGTRITDNVVYGTTRKIAGRGIPILDDNEFVEGFLPEPPVDPLPESQQTLSRSQMETGDPVEPEQDSAPITH